MLYLIDCVFNETKIVYIIHSKKKQETRSLLKNTLYNLYTYDTTTYNYKLETYGFYFNEIEKCGIPIWNMEP